MPSAYTEFGRPSVTLGRKGLRTITRLGWVPSIQTQPQNAANVILSPGQRDTASQETSVPPSASDSPPSPMQNYRYFGAFLTGQKIAATSRDGARALCTRTFEELNDGTIDVTALLYQGTLTETATGKVTTGLIFGANTSGVQTWPPSQPPTPANPWNVPATYPTTVPTGFTYAQVALAVPAFAARTFQQVMPFRFPGVYSDFPPVSKHVTSTVVEYFFLADPAIPVLGYEPLRWCQLVTNYTPDGGSPAAPVYQYYPGYLSGGFAFDTSGDFTYNGILCSYYNVASTSSPGDFPAQGYQMVQVAKDFYGEGGILYMRRDVYVNFPASS